MEKVSDFVKELREATEEGVAVFDGMMHKARVVGYLMSIENKVKEMEDRNESQQTKTSFDDYGL